MGVTLSAPITSKWLVREGDENFQVGCADMQGFRMDMEDAESIELSLGKKHPRTAFFGVYDGHGGAKASKYLSEELTKAVGNMKTPTDPKALKRVMLEVDAKFLKREDQREDGTTCVFAIVEPLFEKKAKDVKKTYKITVANIGDSRAILVKANGEHQPLTEDHKPENSIEFKRIVNAGGTVQGNRVDGQLALSRAIGDYNYKDNPNLPASEQKVIPIPDVTVCVAEEGDTLLVCCDGLFEQLTNQEVANFAYEDLKKTNFSDQASSMTRLIDYSLEKGSKDNMTAMAVTFMSGVEYKKNSKSTSFEPGRFHEHKHDDKFRKAYLTDAMRHGIEEKELLKLVPAAPEGWSPPEPEEQSNSSPIQQMLAKALGGDDELKQKLLMAMLASNGISFREGGEGGEQGGEEEE